MAEYTYSEIMKMQNDAIKRVEEMQKKARKTVGLDEEQPAPENKEPVPVQEPKRVPMPNDYLEKLKDFARSTADTRNEEEKQEEKKEAKKEKPFFDNGKNSFLNLRLDDDKTLLLALIMLLSEEGADELLIMALIYMLT